MFIKFQIWTWSAISSDHPTSHGFADVWWIDSNRSDRFNSKVSLPGVWRYVQVAFDEIPKGHTMSRDDILLRPGAVSLEATLPMAKGCHWHQNCWYFPCHHAMIMSDFVRLKFTTLLIWIVSYMEHCRFPGFWGILKDLHLTETFLIIGTGHVKAAVISLDGEKSQVCPQSQVTAHYFFGEDCSRSPHHLL